MYIELSVIVRTIRRNSNRKDIGNPVLRRLVLQKGLLMLSAIPFPLPFSIPESMSFLSFDDTIRLASLYMYVHARGLCILCLYFDVRLLKY